MTYGAGKEKGEGARERRRVAWRRGFDEHSKERSVFPVVSLSRAPFFCSRKRERAPGRHKSWQREQEREKRAGVEPVVHFKILLRRVVKIFVRRVYGGMGESLWERIRKIKIQ